MQYQSRRAHYVLVFVVLTTMIFGCARLQPSSVDTTGTTASQYANNLGYTPVKVSILDSACLVGKWNVSNLQQVMYESYLHSQSAFQLENINGQAVYEFDTQGTMTIYLVRLAASMNGEVDKQKIRVYQEIDGSATALYTIDQKSSRLFLTGFGGDGVLFSLDINGQRLLEGDLPSWRAFTSDLTSGIGKPTSLVDYAYVQVECNEDVLTIQSIDPLPGPLVQLKRMQ
jgi:hypothetical protein